MRSCAVSFLIGLYRREHSKRSLKQNITTITTTTITTTAAAAAASATTTTTTTTEGH